jgi:hypothetical protein
MIRVLIIGAIVCLSLGCDRAREDRSVYYSTGIHNKIGISTWPPDGYTLPEDTVEWTLRCLRHEYEKYTNHFEGSIVLYRYQGTNKTTCFVKAMSCDETTASFEIGDGHDKINMVQMHSFDEVVGVLSNLISREVSNKSNQGTGGNGRSRPLTVPRP